MTTPKAFIHIRKLYAANFPSHSHPVSVTPPKPVSISATIRIPNARAAGMWLPLQTLLHLHRDTGRRPRNNDGAPFTMANTQRLYLLPVYTNGTGHTLKYIKWMKFRWPRGLQNCTTVSSMMFTKPQSLHSIEWKGDYEWRIGKYTEGISRGLFLMYCPRIYPEELKKKDTKNLNRNNWPTGQK
jgi:hypothetical protein